MFGGLGRFMRNDRGNVAMTFALSAFPLLAVSGVAVDYGRMTQTENAMQAAADAVSLALAQEYNAKASEAQLRRVADGLFKQAIDVSALRSWSVNYSYDTSKSTVTVTADATIDTSILSLFRIDDLDISVRSNSTYNSGDIEIVLVLDNTGSMAFWDKLNQLKIASRNFITALKNSSSGVAGKAKIAIVPFAATVKVGTENARANWITGGNQNILWPGCVGDRRQPYTATKTAPNTGIANSLYPPDYLLCTTAKIMPLTSDWNAATARVNEMVANGLTNVPIGLAWGWNMLTPGVPLSQADGSGRVPVQRVLILLTDGTNTYSTLGGFPVTIDQLMDDTCDAIKADGITVFTVRVIEGNENLIRSCASDPANYYNVNNATKIDSVFKKIMQDISKLRLSS